TAEIGLFKIVSESSVASGVRRIEAIAGRSIPQWLKQLDRNAGNLRDDMARQAERIKQLEKELLSYKVDELKTIIPDMVATAEQLDGYRLAVRRIDGVEMEQLKSLGDELRSGLKSQGIGLLAAVIDDKVQLVCVATDDMAKLKPAGKIVGAVAKELGGGGGGKPHMATAGGKDIEKLDIVLKNIPSLISTI
ncbi:MAG: DHHA1 domain-containing protein, partial [Ignavibacteria bacterium]